MTLKYQDQKELSFGANWRWSQLTAVFIWLNQEYLLILWKEWERNFP